MSPSFPSFPTIAMTPKKAVFGAREIAHFLNAIWWLSIYHAQKEHAKITQLEKQIWNKKFKIGDLATKTKITHEINISSAARDRGLDSTGGVVPPYIH